LKGAEEPRGQGLRDEARHRIDRHRWPASATALFARAPAAQASAQRWQTMLDERTVLEFEEGEDPPTVPPRGKRGLGDRPRAAQALALRELSSCPKRQ
jgi:hypothetical protein